MVTATKPLIARDGRTHCKRGHEYVKHGRRDKRGCIHCQACDKLTQQDRTKRYKANEQKAREVLQPVASYNFTDPSGRTHCKHSHPWTEATRRIDCYGIWHCRVCAMASWERNKERKAKGLPKNYIVAAPPKAEKNPITAPTWKRCRLPAFLDQLRGEKAIRLVVRAFIGHFGSEPNVILAAPINICCYGEVTVRERRDREPAPDEATYFVR